MDTLMLTGCFCSLIAGLCHRICKPVPQGCEGYRERAPHMLLRAVGVSPRRETGWEVALSANRLYGNVMRSAALRLRHWRNCLAINTSSIPWRRAGTPPAEFQPGQLEW